MKSRESSPLTGHRFCQSPAMGLAHLYFFSGQCIDQGSKCPVEAGLKAGGRHGEGDKASTEARALTR